MTFNPQPKPAKSPKKARTRVKATNPKRKASAFQRAYGSRARVEWVKTLACLACRRSYADGDVPIAIIQNAHVSTGGMGRKANADQIVPLCTDHHGRLHQWGRSGFESFFGLNLTAEAAAVEAVWQAHLQETMP